MRFWTLFVFLLLGLALAPGAWADTAAPQTKLPLPYTYAYLTNWETGVEVYDAPGGNVIRTVTTPDTWVSIHGEQAGWVRINNGEWVRRSDLWYAQPSYLHGYEFTGQEQGRLGFVYAQNLNIRSRAGLNSAWVGSLRRYTAVEVYDEQWAGGQIWYRIGENRWVLGDWVIDVLPVKRPAQVGPDEKWIDVNLAQQTLVAYEGDRPVYATLVSSGRKDHETARGLNRIWVKLDAGRMSGGNPADPMEYYNLEDVPWTMYFYKDFGVHGAYWHDQFGGVRSHGCVNLSPIDSFWVYNWAGPYLAPGQKYVYSSADNPGTWVYTH